MYTTIRGLEVELSKKLWKGIKCLARKRLRSSDALFEACWRDYLYFVRNSETPDNINDVMRILDQIVSEKVNNPKSRFYIYG